jgi:hypothetical protein
MADEQDNTHSPDRTRKGQFEKGSAKTGGRRTGVANSITREVFEALHEAAVLSGHDKSGRLGLSGIQTAAGS